MNSPQYPFTVRPLTEDEGGGWLVEFPDLPGCMADGETPEEAVSEGEDAVRSWIAAMREAGRPIPEPSKPNLTDYSGKWLQRVPRTLHRKLVERARTEGVSLNTLVTAILAEGVGERQASARDS
jgi:antitoxin HicB